MKIQQWRSIGAVVAMLVITAACSGDKSEQDSAGHAPLTQPAVIPTGFYGWRPVTLQNAFVRLDVVPELGGRAMGYSLLGSQVLWHNPDHEGDIDIFATPGKDGRFINAGGARVWPEPREAWGGPPDAVLDGAPYEVSSDDSTITVTSPADTAPGRTGLLYSHRYTLRPRSTAVGLELSMTNRSDTDKNWAMRHLVALPADSSTTICVPATSNSDWRMLDGDPAADQWLGVEDGLFRARFDGATGSVAITPNDGWAAWHDAERNIAYVVRFPRENGAVYPDGGNQLEISSTGEVANESGNVDPGLSFFELSVMGPLTDLAPGERSTLDLVWNVCRCSGVRRVTPVGIVAEELAFYPGPNILTGRFGTFTAGTLVEYFYDKDGGQTARARVMQVTPQTEVVLRREIYVPLNTVGIRYELWGPDETYLGEFADITLPAEARR